MAMIRSSSAVWILMLSLMTSSAAAQEEPISAGDLFQQFSKLFDDDGWLPADDPRRPGYMRPLGDAGWKSRMHVLQELARYGDHAAAELKRVLQHGSTQKRILAAQAAGLIQAEDCRSQLARAAEHDSDPAVRLHAIDSLAMLGGDEHRELFERLSRSESNRDLKKHLTYALERQGKPLDPAVVTELRQWNPKLMDTARLGDTAPDFELTSLGREAVRLSDFRGKKHVVLVFIYGDT